MGIDDYDQNQFVDTDLLRRISPGVDVSAYQLGDPDFGGTYQSVDEIALIIEGLLSAVPGGPYENSVNEGRQELIAYLTDRHAQCGSETYILGGYSEGADVIGSGLSDLPRAVRDRRDCPGASCSTRSTQTRWPS